jgi:hypothetical protein
VALRQKGPFAMVRTIDAILSLMKKLLPNKIKAIVPISVVEADLAN